MGNKKAFGNAWHLDSQMSEPKLLVQLFKTKCLHFPQNRHVMGRIPLTPLCGQTQQKEKQPSICT